MNNEKLMDMFILEEMMDRTRGRSRGRPGGGGGAAPFINTKSFLFGGGNEWLKGPGSQAVVGVSPTCITYSAWIKTTNTGNQYVQSIKRDLTSSSSLFSLRTFGADKVGLVLRLAASTISPLYTVPAGLTDGAWHHICASWHNSTGAVCYVDGVLVGTDANNLAVDADLEEPYTVAGFSTVSPLSFNGNVEEPGVFEGGAMFSLAEAQELYNQTGPGKPGNLSLTSRAADLKSWYRNGDDPLDDATGTTGRIVDQVDSPALDATPQNTEAGDIVTDTP